MIDDDQEYLGLCTLILRDDGHEVTACSDFNEGRRLLAGEHFDALIADVRLGAYNGLHLIALAPPSMIKIAWSAFYDPVLRHDAEQVGARYVLKPTDCASVSSLLAQTDQVQPAGLSHPGQNITGMEAIRKATGEGWCDDDDADEDAGRR
jgi:DNA-binding response OmpR family regulator